MPPADFFGEDEFSYSVADEMGATSVSLWRSSCSQRASRRGVGSGLFPGQRFDPEPSEFTPSLGESVVSAGDFNGDGFDDLAIFDIAAGAYSPPDVAPAPTNQFAFAPAAPPQRPNPGNQIAQIGRAHV